MAGLLIPGSQAEEKRVREGDNLEITVGDYQQVTIIDENDNILLNTINNAGQEIKLKEHPKMTVKQGKFTMENVRESDEGQYEIRVNTKDGKALPVQEISIFVLIPPEIRLSPLQNSFQESELKVAVAKCRADGGKPQATVSWRFSSSSQDLSSLTGMEESLLELAPSRLMHGKSVDCIVSHEALDAPLSHSMTLNVEFKPGKPVMKMKNFDCSDESSNKQLELICEDNSLGANPPIDFIEWTLPGIDGPRVTEPGRGMKIDRRTASEDAVYSCVTKNAIGVSEIESKSLSELNFEACPSSASLGLIIGIVVIAIVLTVVGIAICFWKKLFCFRNCIGKKVEKENIVKDPVAPYDYEPVPPATKPPVDSEDESDDNTNLVRNNNRHEMEDEFVDDPRRRYSPDYDPNTATTEPHYASLNKSALGVRKSATPIERRPVEYASLADSSGQKFQMV